MAGRRVAYLHDGVAFGGIETLQCELLRWIDRDRYEPVVVLCTPAGGAGHLDQFAADVRATGTPLLEVAATTHGPLGAARRTRELARLLRREQVEVVHVQTRHPTASRWSVLGAWSARVPVIVRTEHVSPGPHLTRWTRWAVRPFDRMSEVLVTDSDTDRDDQIRLVGRPPERVVRSYCGIDASRFDGRASLAEAKRRLDLPTDRPVVGTVGRLHQQKGTIHLVHAAAEVLRRHPAALFLVVGDGPLEAELRAEAARLGVGADIVFAGFQADPRPYMEAMDVAVMPSLWEGFSISMQEFMALGTPLVTSDHHSFREALVDGVHGRIVPTGDDAALAEAIAACLADPAAAQAMGAAAAERVRQRFTIDGHARELMDLYDRLLGAEALEPVG